MNYTDYIKKATEFATEERGFGQWVPGCDTPAVPDEYVVKVRAELNGETVEFMDMNEPCFTVSEDEDGGCRFYEVDSEWDTYTWEKAGYTNIEVLEWKQYEGEEVA